MALTRVPLKDFRGGLNTRDNPFQLQANESPDLRDVTISSLVGALESRKGSQTLANEGIPESTEINHMKQVVLGAVGSGVRALMLSINGEVWYLDPGGGPIKKLFKGTAGSVWDFEVYADAAFKDWVYMSNGVDAPQKWDGAAAATVAWPITTGALPNGKVICVWENRMFITGVASQPQRIYFSEFSDPEGTLKEYGFVDVRGQEDDMDSVQDLAVLGSRLIVLKRRSIYFISSAVTMANRRIGGPGVWDRFQCAELEDKLYFFNPQGIFSTGGVQVSMESGQISPFFAHELDNISSNLSRARLVATKDTYPRLLLAVSTTQILKNTERNDTLVEMVPHINFRRIGGRRYLLLPAFLLHSVATSALATWNPVGTEEKIVGAGEANENAYIPATTVLDSFLRAENPLAAAGWTKETIGTGTQGTAQCETTDLTNTTLGTTAAYFWNNPVGAGSSELGTILTVEQQAKITPSVGNWFALLVNWFHTGSTVHGIKVAFKLDGTGYTIRVVRHQSAGEETLLGEKTLVAGDNVAGVTWGILYRNNTIYVCKKFSGGKWKYAYIVEEPLTNSSTGIKGGLVLETVSGAEKVKLKNFSEAPGSVPKETKRYILELFANQFGEDFGVPIESYWQSSWQAVQADEPKERLRRLNFERTGLLVTDVYTDFQKVTGRPAFSHDIPSKLISFGRVRPETFGRYHSIRVRMKLQPRSTDFGSLPKAFTLNSIEMVIRGGKEH